MIRANASRYPISAQCRILGVPRSTYYWMIEHPEAERVDPIAGDVHAIWRDSHERYGARKIKAALERRGVTASRRRIVNIMKRRGMTSAYARRTFKPHKTRVNEAWLANILDREFDGYEPRTHLASDLTYVRVGGKWAYVCLLIDLANRSIAGHSADTSRTADLVMAAFATLDFPLTEVEVFHTDRGQRVRQRENRRAARRVRHQKIAVKEGQPVRQRRGRIHQQAPEEGAHIPEPLHQPGTTTLRPQRLCVVVQQPKTPLHPRIPESEGIHRTGTRPLRTCPTHRCQSMSNVTPTRIIYSDEFKRYFLREHGKGRGVTEIFRNAGLPVLIIGGKRIERCTARWGRPDHCRHQ